MEEHLKMFSHVGFFRFRWQMPTAQGSCKNCRTILDHVVHLGSDKEHVALLENCGKFDLLRRKSDLLDEGVAAIFGLADADAELLGLCFHADKFTPAQAAQWLVERGFALLIFVPNSGSNRCRPPNRLQSSEL